MVNKWSPGCNCSCGDCCTLNFVADDKSWLTLSGAWQDPGPLENATDLYFDCQGFASSVHEISFPLSPNSGTNPRSLTALGVCDGSGLTAGQSAFLDALSPFGTTDPNGYVLSSNCTSGNVFEAVTLTYETDNANFDVRYFQRGGSVRYFCDEEGIFRRYLDVTASYTLGFLNYGSGGGGTPAVWLPYQTDFSNGADYTWDTSALPFSATATRNDGLATIKIDFVSRTHTGGTHTAWKIFARTWLNDFAADSVSVWNGAYDPLGWLVGTATLS